MQERMSDAAPQEASKTSVWLRPSRRIGEAFQNPVPTKVGTLGLIFKAMPLYIKNHEQRTPLHPPGPFRTDTTAFASEPASGLRVTWFGHSGMLVELDGFRVLIDPIWEKRASPRQWFGPRRFFSPPLELEDLPPLDAILISHDHYDHMGEETLRRLARLRCAQRAQWITAVGVGGLLRAWGVVPDQISELDWMDKTLIRNAYGAELGVTSVPARHFSGRSLLRRFRTLWGSYVLKGTTHTVYFGADTGWWEGFSEIAKNFGPFDLTMLEIGAYNELWKDIHLGPENAARAFQTMGKDGLLMPIHWGLFDLALHGWTQPISQLRQISQKTGIPLWSPEPGRPTEVVAGKPLLDLWWEKNL